MADNKDFKAVCDFIRFLLFPDIYTPCGISKDSICEVKRINGYYRNNAESTPPVLFLAPWLVKINSTQRDNIALGRVNTNGTVTLANTDSIFQHSPSFAYRNDILYRPLTSVTTLTFDSPSISQSTTSGLLGFLSGSLLYARYYMNTSSSLIPTTSYQYRSGTTTTPSVDTCGFDSLIKLEDSSLRLVNICEIAEIMPKPISYYTSVFIDTFPTSSSDTMVCLLPDSHRGAGSCRSLFYVHMTNYYEVQYDKMLDLIPVNTNAPEGIGMVPGEHIMNSFQKSIDVKLVLNLINADKYSLMFTKDINNRLNTLESDLQIIEKRWEELRSERAQAVVELEEVQRKQQEEVPVPEIVDLDPAPILNRRRRL